MKTKCQICFFPVNIQYTAFFDKSICEDCYNDDELIVKQIEVDMKKINSNDLKRYYYQKHYCYLRIDVEIQDLLRCTNDFSMYKTVQERKSAIQKFCNYRFLNINSIMKNKAVKNYVKNGIIIGYDDDDFFNYIRCYVVK